MTCCLEIGYVAAPPRHCEKQRDEAIQLVSLRRDGLLPPSPFELRRTSRFARNDGESVWAPRSRGRHSELTSPPSSPSSRSGAPPPTNRCRGESAATGPLGGLRIPPRCSARSFRCRPGCGGRRRREVVFPRAA